MATEDTQTPPPTRRRRRRGRIALAIVLVVLLAVGGFVWYGLSESGLPFVVARIVAQSGGRLEIEGASGSAASTMRFRRLVWRGSDTTVEADDVVVEWRPGALWRSELSISGLGAARVSIAIKPSSGATPPPTNLALPLAVSLDRVAVGELIFRAGPRTNRITGLAFGYRGDASRHALDGLRLVSDYGALSGSLTLGATAPLPLRGQLAIVGDGPLRDARLDAGLTGTLAELAIAAHGALRGAELDAQVGLTPFATSPLARAEASLRHVDASAFDASLPKTAVDVTAIVMPASDGFTGTAEVRNELPGPLDAAKLPFDSASARYRWHPAAIELESLDVRLPGGGRVSGRGRLPQGEPRAPSTWNVTLANVDPALLHTHLLHARVGGQLQASVDGARQVLSGTLADGRNDVTFAATIAGGRVDVASARLRAGSGVLEGRGSVALEGSRAFEAHVNATHFDPSRLVAGPGASLDGTLDVRGVAQAAWRAVADAQVRPGSRYDGIAVSGSLHAALSPAHAEDVKVEADAGGAKITLSGAAGAVGDRLAFTLDAARLDALAGVLPAALRPAAGNLRAQGTLRIEPGGLGGDVHATAAELRLGNLRTAATLAADASVAAGGNAAHPLTLFERSFEVKVDASAARIEGRCWIAPP